MRSATAASTRRLARLAPLCVALALFGCSRDLEMPPVPSGPTLAGFSPPSAYAGQLLRVSGSHFEAEASANTVNFAHASARAERRDGADLLVRVPAGAGDGPLSVSNRDGTSAASPAAFDYLGMGQLARSQIVSAEPILHRPLRVHAVAGAVLLESSLLALEGTSPARHGLVQYGAPDAFPVAVSTSAAAPWRNELLTTVDDASGTTLTVWPMDGSGPPRPHRLDGVWPWRILAARPVWGDATQDLLVTFQLEGGVETIRTYRLDESAHGGHDHAAVPPPALPPLLGSTDLGLSNVVGPVDVQDGRVVVVARNVADDGGILAVIRLSDGAVTKRIDPPAGRALPYERADRAFDGLAAGRRFEGIGHLAAAALDGGWVMLVDLDNLAADPTVFTVLVSTYSAAPVGGIALATMGGTGSQTVIVAAKPDDDLVVGIDPWFANVAWGLPTRGARRVATVDTVAWIANDADNEVQVVNVATARQVGRLSFDVAPGMRDAFGDPDPASGLAFAPADPLDAASVDTLYLTSRTPGALLKIPLDASVAASCLARSATLAQVAWDGTGRAPWATEGGALQALAFTAAADPYGGSPPVTLPIPGATQARRIVFAGSSAVVAHDAGLTAISGGAIAGSVAVSAPVYGSVGTTPDGMVWLNGSWDGAEHAQLWSAAAIAAGGPPAAEWSTSDFFVFWSVWLEDGLWVETWDGAADPAMVLLDRSGAALQPARSVTPAAAASFLLIPPAALSPNGRTLVMWEYRGADTALRFFSADPATGFAELGYLPLEGTVTGAAFDDTGERLYVLTQGPDRLVTID